MEPTYIKFQKFIKSTQYGYTADETSTESGDCKYLRITDIVPYFVDKDHVPYCKIAEGKKSQYIVSNGDLLIARTGATTGYNLVIDDSFNNFIFASYLIRFNLDKNKLYPLFVKYVLKSKSWYGFVNNYVGGSAQPGMNARVFGKFDFPYLPLPTQRRIASILSTYDALIQNYKRQIAALQSAASELYKEWFVRFRFPGYKNAKFDNGLPVGWKVEKLFDIAKIIYGFPFNSDKFCNDSTLKPVVRIRDIIDNHTNTYTNEDCDEKYWINPNELLIGMDGIFHMTLWTGERALQNQRTVRLTSNRNNLSNYFLYFSLYPQIKALEQMIVGTTVAHLGDKHLKKITVLIPNEKILVQSFNQFETIQNQIYLLQQQITNLTTQRDLLLPRLMSGKLSVE